MVKVTRQINDPDLLITKVFSTDKLETATELNSAQIEIINKLTTLTYLTGANSLKVHIETFMALQKSKDRQGMKEFIEALRSKKQDVLDKVKGYNLIG